MIWAEPADANAPTPSCRFHAERRKPPRTFWFCSRSDLQQNNLVPVLLQPTTLPQGTVNMNLCSDITDAEPRTGQRNALCVVTPEQEIFIRGDSREIINGSV